MNTRKTAQKKIILDAVGEMASHPTAEDVYKYIHSANPGIGKATVYRNLRHLSDTGKLKRIETANQADHYDHKCHDHYHFQCKKCNRVYDMDIDYIQALNDPIIPSGFQIENHDIIFKGLCPKCR